MKISQLPRNERREKQNNWDGEDPTNVMAGIDAEG
jgi:hypothetical protein